MAVIPLSDQVALVGSDIVIIYGAGRIHESYILAARAGRKRILYYRPQGQGRRPLPKALKGYANLRIVEGHHAVVVAAVEEWEAE